MLGRLFALAGPPVATESAFVDTGATVHGSGPKSTPAPVSGPVSGPEPVSTPVTPISVPIPCSSPTSSTHTNSTTDEAQIKRLLYGPGPRADPDPGADFEPSRHVRVVFMTGNRSAEVLYDSLAHAQEVPLPQPQYQIPTRGHRRSQSHSYSSSPLSPRLNSKPRSADDKPPRESWRPPSARDHPSPCARVSTQEMWQTACPLDFLVFTDPMTKLHPLPQDDAASDRQTWLLSRVFRVPAPELLRTASPAHMSTVLADPAELSHRSSDPSPAPSSPSASESSWTVNLNPTPRPIPLLIDSRPRPVYKSTELVTCALCVVFSIPPGTPDVLTRQWDELSRALGDLQACATWRLLETWQVSAGLHTRSFLSQDSSLLRAVDLFKWRVTTFARVPRVSSGSMQWADVRLQLSWLFDRLGEDATSDPTTIKAFTACVLACFVHVHHSQLLASPANSKTHHCRTMVMCNHRGASQRLVFVLAALLRDRSRDVIDPDTLAHLTAHEPPSHNDDEARMPGTTSKIYSIPRPPKVSLGSSGWQLSSTAESFVDNDVVAYSHNSSLPGAAQLTRALSSVSLSSLGSSGSIMPRSVSSSSHKFWRLGSNASGPFSFTSSAPTSWLDDGGSPAPDDQVVPMSFDHYAELTAQPVHPYMIRGRHTTCSEVSLALSDVQFEDTTPSRTTLPSSPEIHYTIDDNLVTVDMPELDEPKFTPLQTWPDWQPVVCPPVAAHIPDFHPDFCLHAFPSQPLRELDVKIRNAMVRDSDLVAGGDDIVSRSLIVDVQRLEIHEWTLVRTASTLQNLHRRRLFAGRPLTAETRAWTRTVLRRWTDATTEEAVGQAFEDAFGL